MVSRKSKKRASASQRESNVFKYLKSHPGLRLFLHFMLFVLLVVIAFLCVDRFLESYTRHGQEVEVPEFRHLSLDEAYKLANDKKLRLEIVDSVYSKTNKGLVRKQDPDPGSVVKEGRRIFLTINAKNVKVVKMPNLKGLSLRQAVLEMKVLGLSLGNIHYKSDIATNNVLGQLYKGRELKPGDEVETASEIDLIVGLNRRENLKAKVPNLFGKSAEEAIDMIHENYLNINNIEYAPGVVTDEQKSNAVVYMQEPEPLDSLIEYGAGVTIFLDLIEYESE